MNNLYTKFKIGFQKKYYNIDNILEHSNFNIDLYLKDLDNFQDTKKLKVSRLSFQNLIQKRFD
jgi:hypothetical protein